MLISEKEEIIFEPINHTYHDLEGNELISVSRLIHLWAKDFDIDGVIAKRCADRDGITVEEIQKKWKLINEESCIRGTKVHDDIEYFIKTGKIRNNENEHWVKQFSKVKFKGKLFPEARIYCLEDKICGTSDLPELLDEKTKLINISDYKTNKKLQKTSPYNNFMLGHLFYMPDCNFNHYTIQLTIYGYLLEKKGYKINELKIFYFNPETNLMEIHPVEYKKKEVVKLIELYKAGKAPKKHVK